MAGSKTLNKFKDSKIPKKGTGTTSVEVPIYQEPNTHSKIIGTIKKDDIINWISKSICDEREWVRCDKINNFGYIIGNEIDGKCNLNMDTVQEKKEEKKENIFNYNEDIIISKEEYEIGLEGFREILEEKDGGDENYDDANLSNSTETGNNSTHNDVLIKDDDEYNNDDIFKENYLDNLYFDENSNIDNAIKENKKELNYLFNKINQDKENENNISKALQEINDIIPGHNNLTNKDLLNTLDSIPRGKKNNNISTMITVADDLADEMKKVKGSIRLTDGELHGNNFSPKYYSSGWNGGSRAQIKTYKVSKIGEKISKITKPLQKGLTVVKICKSLIEGGNTATVEISEEAGSFLGEKLGKCLGGLIGGPIGYFIGGYVGSFFGGKYGKKYGESIVEKNKKNKEDKK